MRKFQELQPERPVVKLTPGNLKSLLEDMGAEPGIYYAASDLYDWYRGMCRSVEAEPVSKKAFGTSLKNQRYRNAVRRINGKPVRCWFFSRRAFRDVSEHPEWMRSEPS